ncbi:MAG: sulfotransferase [Gammaproteobacteria bacterium]|nr:sulfotransferase [Gammaproteobacteria bacterium]
MHTFDIVVTCKGRLEHLKQSLPQLLKQTSSTVFLVDYDCPNQSGEWAHKKYNKVNVIKVTKSPEFNLSHARNLGAKPGSAPWILFIDADILLPENFLATIQQKIKPKHFFHGNGIPASTYGTCIIERSAFHLAEGYDVIIRGWGGEDIDLYTRLEALGYTRNKIELQGINVLPHSDEKRMEFNPHKSIHYNQVKNRLYRTSIADLHKFNPARPNISKRKQLYQHIEFCTDQLFSDKQCSDLYLKLSQETIKKAGGNEKSELVRTLHYHMDSNPADWTPGQENKPSDHAASIVDTISVIKKRWPNCISTSNEAPVFIFASGFRSGSTMLQRSLFNHCFMWGEPYGNSGLLDHLIAPLLHLSAAWPIDNFFYDSNSAYKNLTDKWVANLYPEPKHLIKATQSYLEQLLKSAAIEAGQTNWGFKEVRYNAEHALFLNFIYPKAKFLFLYRNPYDAYRSYREHSVSWYLRFNDKYIDTPQKFAAHWVETTQSFFQFKDELNAKVLRYEDIINPAFNWDEINQYLGFTIDMQAIKTKVKNKFEKNKLSEDDLNNELKQLEKTVSPLASKLNYFLNT